MGTGGTDFSSGLPENKLINELPNQDARQLCESANNFFDQVFTNENFCRLVFMTLGTFDPNTPIDGAMCRESVKQCTEELQQQPREKLDCAGPDGAGTSQDFAACPAPIRLFENCLNDTADIFKEVFDALDCSAIEGKLISQLGDATSVPTQPPPSCVELNRLCPGLIIQSN